MKKNLHIVGLGGGMGVVNLIKGLRDYTDNVSIVISMADDGGSAGRLRRLYDIPPPGDLVSCMAALSTSLVPETSDFLTYRFPGERYGKDNEIAGQKIGNLMMVALRDITGSFEKAIEVFQKIFNVKGTFLPVADRPLSLTITTKKGTIAKGEETIDLGKFPWAEGIDTVTIEPADITAPEKVIEAIKNAEMLIGGPGDLYTTLIPVFIVPGVKEAILESKAEKVFILNVANKPYETNNYTATDFIDAVKKHLGSFPFTTVIANNNFSVPIPSDFDHTYVTQYSVPAGIRLIEADLVSEELPLYHDSAKLAKVIQESL